MKSIELQTTQNVTINYQLALLRDRIFAFILDVIIIVMAVLFIGAIAIEWLVDPEWSTEFSFLVLSPISTFYTLAFESLNNGKTVGKMVLGIQVVRVDGKPMRFNDYLLRWVFRMLDIWFSSGAIAVIAISSTDKSQRLGGMLSNSTVVKSNPGLQLTLGDILKINTTTEHTPQYPEVRHFREEDMLLVKQSLDRYHKFRNKAHREAIELLTTRMCEQLGIEVEPSDKVAFLRGLIKDFIVLTR